MVWHDLLFAHWPLPSDVLRRAVPPALPLDTFEGRAWIGVVPFRMSGVRARCTPPAPGLAAFPEINVRTYVTLPGQDGAPRPGVYFFSLDAASAPAVHTARLMFHLNYYTAQMHCTREPGDRAGWVNYASTRTHRRAPAAVYRARYRPTGAPYPATPGTIESWLTDRYCLYTADRRGRPHRAEIHHAPWPLQPAEAEVEHNAMTTQIGVNLPDVAPLLHFVERLDVIAWLPSRGGAAEPQRVEPQK